MFAIGRGRVRRNLSAVRDRAVDRDADRLPGATGGGGRAADPQLAGGDRRHVSPAGARPGDRDLDGVGNDRRRARSAGRRRDLEHRVVAVDLRDQSAARDRLPVADPQSGPRGQARGTAAQGRRDRRGVVRVGPRRFGVRADRAAAPGLVQPGGERLAGGRGARVRGLPGLRVAGQRPDAQARPVQEPQLRGGQRRDAGSVRRPVGAVLLPHAVPAAGGRLLAAEERIGAAAREPRHVRALLALRRARRSTRPALVHGRRPSGRRGRHAHAAHGRGARGLLDRGAPGDPAVLVGPVDHGGAAHRRDPRRRRVRRRRASARRSTTQWRAWPG